VFKKEKIARNNNIRQIYSSVVGRLMILKSRREREKKRMRRTAREISIKRK
jgi:hypothetical protein